MELITRLPKSAVVTVLTLVLLAVLPAQNTAFLPPEQIDPLSIPFEEGEEVRYSVHWKPLFLIPAFKAGDLRLTIERSEYLKSPAFKISAWAKSNGLLTRVAGLDVRDYFESVIDAADFRSRRFLHQERRNQRKRDLEVLLDYPGDRLLIRQVDVTADPPRTLKEESRTGLPGVVLDTLSVFYAARLQALEPGDKFQLYLSESGNIKTVQLEVVERDNVKIELGKFDTVKITTRGGMFKKGGDFRIWYTRDELRVPVKFEADAGVGKVFGELVQLQTPRFATAVVKVP